MLETKVTMIPRGLCSASLVTQARTTFGSANRGVKHKGRQHESNI